MNDEKDRYVAVELARQGASGCLDCGCLTLDRELHDRWHHDLADGVAAIYTKALVDAIEEHEANSPHLYADGSS